MQNTSNGGDSFEDFLRKHSEQYMPTPDAGNWEAIHSRMRRRQAPERRRFILRSTMIILLGVVARYGLLNLNTTFEGLQGYAGQPVLMEHQSTSGPSPSADLPFPNPDQDTRASSGNGAANHERADLNSSNGAPKLASGKEQGHMEAPKSNEHGNTQLAQDSGRKNQAVSAQPSAKGKVQGTIVNKMPGMPAGHAGGPPERSMPAATSNASGSGAHHDLTKVPGVKRNNERKTLPTATLALTTNLGSEIYLKELKAKKLSPIHKTHTWKEFSEAHRPQKWDLYVYGGVGRAQTRTTLAREYEVPTYQGDVMVKPDASYTNYSRQMARMEVGRYGAQFGYRLGKKGWKFYTGFDYQQIRRNMAYYHNQSPRNESVAFLDYRSHKAHGYEVIQKQAVNEYEFVSMPLALGYQFQADDQLNFDLSVGMAYQHLLSANAMEYNFYFEEFRQENHQSMQVYNDHQLHGQMALRATYELGHYFSLRSGLQYQRSFSSIYDEHYPIDLKVDQLSFDIGLVHDL